jgi:hypothetical protein
LYPISIPRPPNSNIVDIYNPRVSPEGHELWFATRDSSAPDRKFFTVYDRDGETWRWRADLPFGLGPDEAGVISPPSRADAGPRRIMLLSYGSSVVGPYLLEHVEVSPDTWMPTGDKLSFDQLDVSYAGSPYLSPDAKRIVFVGVPRGGGQARVMYMSRTQIDLPFPMAVPVDGVPGQASTVWAINPYYHLTEDCSRIYFTALGSVFYVQQE